MTIVTQHDFAACPRTRDGPVKFSTQHRSYPVGFVSVPAAFPWGPRIPRPAACLYRLRWPMVIQLLRWVAIQ